MKKPKTLIEVGAAVTLAVAIIQQHGERYGWRCVSVNHPDLEMTTPLELSKRLGVKYTTIWRRLHSRQCPKYYSEHGPTGRLIKLHVTDAVLKYLKRPVLPPNEGLLAMLKKNRIGK